MDSMISKDVTTTRGLQYRYYVSDEASADTQKPTLLLLHGFPDTASCWRLMLPSLRKAAHIIAVDTLGYGGSSKTTDTLDYAYHLMVQDLMEILDAEKVQKAVVIGHDHGAYLASRVYNHVPDRTVAVGVLNVAYQAPNKKDPFNLTAINTMTAKFFGYGTLEYWYFFTGPTAGPILNANLERAWEITHPGNSDTMRDIYGVHNALRDYLTDPEMPTIKTKPHAANADLKAEWIASFKSGGFEAPLCWYTVHTQQIQSESDKSIPDENIRADVPVLYIGCDEDAICRPELILPTQKAGMLPHLTNHTMKGVGHWPMYEKPEETAEIILNWLDSIKV